MKKIILMSLFATLLSVFTASAQNNTYSMVIKMQNGTVLTIGPNEADSIFFNEGRLNVTGQSIEDILKRLDSQDADIKAMTNAIYKLDAETKTVQADMQNSFDKVNDMVYKNLNDINVLNAKVSEQQELIYMLMNKIEMLQMSIDEMKARDDAQEKEINSLANDNEAMKVKIAQLEDSINVLLNQ